jgi:hypothetical protein
MKKEDVAPRKVDDDLKNQVWVPEDTKGKTPLDYKIKQRRIKHGFSKEILGNKCTVFFEYFNEKVTKCHLLVSQDSFTDEFIGISKVDPRDTYDRVIGENNSLAKAIDKYIEYNNKIVEMICMRQERLNAEINDGLFIKLTKVQNS